MEVCSDKEKGCILVAQKAFKTGDLIFEEDPLMLVDMNSFPQSIVEALEIICHEANLLAIVSGGPSQELDEDCCISVRTLLPALQFLREDFPTQHKTYLMYCPSLTNVPLRLLLVIRRALQLALDRGVIDRCVAACAGERHVVGEVAVLEHIVLVCQGNIFAVTDDASSSALCFAAGILSHSCLPSCNWHFTPGGRYQLRAAQPVAVGDELTVSYLEAER